MPVTLNKELLARAKAKQKRHAQIFVRGLNDSKVDEKKETKN